MLKTRALHDAHIGFQAIKLKTDVAMPNYLGLFLFKIYTKPPKFQHDFSILRTIFLWNVNASSFYKV